MKPKRMGRPLKQDAKRKQITVRLTDEKIEQLVECAKRTGVTRTKVVEDGISLYDAKHSGK